MTARPGPPELLRDARGATLVEYLVVLGLVALAGMAAWKTFGASIFGASGRQGACVAEIGPDGTPTGCEGAGGTQGPLASGGPAGGDTCPGGVCGRPGQCFVAGTPVVTPDGLQPIEQIHAGDTVLSRDEASGALVPGQVVRTFTTPAQPVVDVRIAEAPGTDLRATPGHPFWTLRRGWVPAAELDRGEEVLTADGASVHVESVTAQPSRRTVYNFEVADTHTYFVGAARIWVHNACDPATIPLPPSPVDPATVPLPPSPVDPATIPLPPSPVDPATIPLPPSPVDPEPPAPDPNDEVTTIAPSDSANLDQAFLSSLNKKTVMQQVGTTWTVGSKLLSAGGVVAQHFHPVPFNPAAVVQLPVNYFVAKQKYNELYNQLTPQLTKLYQVHGQIPPDAAYDPERAAIAYTIIKLNHILTQAYGVKETATSVGGMANHAVGMAHGGEDLTAATALPGMGHSAKKKWTGQTGVENTAAAYILLDQAFLNNSPYAKQGIEALYSKEHAQQLGEGWQTIYQAEQKLPSPSGSPKIWNDERALIRQYGKVNVTEIDPGDPGSKRPPKFGVPSYAPYNAALIGDRPPPPDRQRLRPLEDYPDESISSTFGKGSVPPRTTTGKTWNAAKGAIPFVKANQTPDRIIGGHVANGLGGKPQNAPRPPAPGASAAAP